MRKFCLLPALAIAALAVGRKWRININITMVEKVTSSPDFSSNQADKGTEMSPIFIERTGLRVNIMSISVMARVISSSVGIRTARTPIVGDRPFPPVNFR